MKRLFLFTLLILPLSLPAQDLVEFQNGQVADADDMNANFSSLKEAIDALSIEDEVLSNGIKLYPNPTTNQFTIEIESTSPLSEGIKIEVYDHLGRTIRTDIIEKDGSGKTTIPLNNYASGTYFIKCYNTTLETHFKVIKI